MTVRGRTAQVSPNSSTRPNAQQSWLFGALLLVRHPWDSLERARESKAEAPVQPTRSSLRADPLRH